MRLIDADKLLAELKAVDYLRIGEMREMVENAPTVGRWHVTDKELPKLQDVAGEYLTATKHSDGSFEYSVDEYKYPWSFENIPHFDRATDEIFYGIDYWMEFEPPEVDACD